VEEPLLRRRDLGRALALPLVAGLTRPVAAQAPAAGAQAPRRGGTMTIVLQPEPPTLMLGLTQAAPTQVAGSKIYQGLLTYDFDLNPLPSLATSWTRSEVKGCSPTTSISIRCRRSPRPGRARRTGSPTPSRSRQA
jgi:ABC-type transport system substrate-binding protein